MEHVEFIDLNNTRSGIYCIFNMRNGKLYIGSAVNLRKRAGSHIHYLMKNKHCNKHLQNAWNKDGIISFLFIVMEYCETDKLIGREQYYFSLFDFDKQLYNLAPTAGSQLGRKCSDESRKKISEGNKGKIISEEIRKKMSNSAKSKVVSKETRLKMAKAMSKPVSQIDKKTGEILATFNSTKEVERTLGISNNHISEACNGRYKTAYGYKWQYVKIEN